MSYMPCELHCHTVHSDGSFKENELLENAKNFGLSLIAITDHNTFSACCKADKNILPFIKGIEWTTYYGHMLVLGINEFVDWRNALPNNIDEKIEKVKESGALVGIAHPFQTGSPVCTGGRWEFNVNKWENVDYIEIWHESFNPDNYENKNALEMWTSLLDKGYKIAAAYGRDWHKNYGNLHFGCTYIDIDGEVTPKKALSAIKSGATVVSCGVKFFMRAKQNENSFTSGGTIKEGKCEFSFYTDSYARDKYRKGDFEYSEIRLVSNGAKTVKTLSLNEKSTVISAEQNRWYRGELWGKYNGKETLLAVTSPVYCK